MQSAAAASRCAALVAILIAVFLPSCTGRPTPLAEPERDVDVAEPKEKTPPLDIPNDLLCVITAPGQGTFVLPAEHAGPTRALLQSLWSEADTGDSDLRGLADRLPEYEAAFYRDYGSGEAARFRFSFNEGRQVGYIVVSARGVGGKRYRASRQLCERLAKLFDTVRNDLPAFQKALEDRDAKVRILACEALRTVGPKARPAVPALTAALKDEDNWVRLAAAQALHRADPGNPAIVPVLCDLLERKEVADRAAGALAEIGPPAKAAIPALTRLHDGPDPFARAAAAKALAAIRGGK